MASVQAKPQLPNEAQIGDVSSAGLISLTMAALRIRTPWTKSLFSERVITLDEASWHDHSGDCWIVIYDRVYDVTKFLQQHPGGSDVLLEYGGRDATVAFRGFGHGHEAIISLRPYLIGQLPRNECIYRKPGGILVGDLPD